MLFRSMIREESKLSADFIVEKPALTQNNYMPFRGLYRGKSNFVHEYLREKNIELCLDIHQGPIRC
jgi:hypothetical protein